MSDFLPYTLLRAERLNEELNKRALKISPAFEGAPTAPTPPLGSSSNRIANMKALSDAIAAASLAVVVDKTSSFTPTLLEAGAYFRCSHVSGLTVQFPANNIVAYPIGTQLSFEQADAGGITFDGAAGVNVLQPAARQLNTAAQFAVVRALKVSATDWVLAGDLEQVAVPRVEPLIIALADETSPITVGVGKAYWQTLFDINPMSEAIIALGAATSSSGSVTVDVQYWTGSAWESIFSDVPTIDVSEFSSTDSAVQPSFAEAAFPKNTRMRADVLSAGTGALGLKLYLIGYTLDQAGGE